MKPLKIREACPDCGAKIGECHKPGCDVECCPFCGRQMLTDNCRYTYFGIDVGEMEEQWKYVYEHGLPEKMDEIYEEHLTPHLLPWDGVWPGIRECREYNLWCKMTDEGWQACRADDPEAVEDLNELAWRTRWDQEAKRYVLAVEEGKGA